ncbi:hypothetical protein [Pseudorhodoferax sp. Leaf267]|uniref:hypothetical protein n=1 Tax=Pseudorhodoferax sp. Leaf267 TaxID=1736316 RepID=UPI00070078A3|nr:hypothetical protein [Pseudorhodoferax sp. Leaf267]KQP18280.1 hypothetical protein ASF43_10685 [Pseudorhodoferax sp. Leaf267]
MLQHDLQHAQTRPTTAPKSDAAKRFAAGLHMDLDVAPNGKAVRHDRFFDQVCERGALMAARPDGWSRMGHRA